MGWNSINLHLDFYLTNTNTKDVAGQSATSSASAIVSSLWNNCGMEAKG